MPKRDEVTGEYRRRPNEELYDVLLNKYLGDKIKKNKMGGIRTMYGGEVRCIQSFGGETSGKETTWKTYA